MVLQDASGSRVSQLHKGENNCDSASMLCALAHLHINVLALIIQKTDAFLISVMQIVIQMIFNKCIALKMGN